MSQLDLTVPRSLRAFIGHDVATPAEVYELHVWHKRRSKRDAGWEERGGAEGRDWAARMSAAISDSVNASMDPGGVHVPVPVGNDTHSDEAEMRATPYAAHPFVDEEWDADAAIGRLRKWAGVDGEEPSAAAWAKYAQGFAIVSGDGNRLGDFHYPHHDVRDGKLVTVPRGVSAAIGALNGARGGGKGLSESEKAAALAHLEKHRKAWEAEKASHEMRGSKLLLPWVRVTAATMRAAVRSSADYIAVSASVIQIACIGAYKGHPQGEFEFTVETFDEIVRNFNATKNHRVPIDHEHGTEMTDPESSIYQHGAPAVGWIIELDNRGEEGLFATVDWVDAVVVERIRTGKTMFFSPAVIFNAIDRVTKENIGAYLTSGGTTNSPFLDGMLPLAASARPADPTTYRIELTAGNPAPTSARTNGEPAPPTKESAMEKTAEHKALEGEHDHLKAEHKALKAEHESHLAKHAAFKGAICKKMALDPEAEESEIIDALEKKLGELDHVQREEAKREKASAEDDVEMVAARMNVTDADAKANLLKLRTADKAAFRKAFGPTLAAAARDNTAEAQARMVAAKAQREEEQRLAAQRAAGGDFGDETAWQRLMSGRVAPGGAAPTRAAGSDPGISDTDAFARDVNEEMVKLTAPNAPFATNGLGALAEAQRIVAARRGGSPRI